MKTEFNLMVTDDLSKFGRKQLNSAKELLEALKKSKIKDELNLQLKWDKQHNDVYLGNESQKFVLGENGLSEVDTDDYGREYTTNAKLKYDRDFEDFVGADILQRELIEYDAITEDYDEHRINEAIEVLDKKEQMIIKSLRGKTLHSLDYANELTEDSAILLSSLMDCISRGDSVFKCKKDIQNALNSFKIELEC